MPRIDRIAEPWGSRTPYGPGETAERCHPQSLRQARWANAHLKVASPQVIAG